MALRYLKKLQPIFNRVGKKHNITIEEGEFIIGELFKSVRNALYDPRMPKVMLPNLGSLKPTKADIDNCIRPSLYWHRKGSSTREFINARVAYLWAVRNRLSKEELGLPTAKEYSTDDAERYFRELQEEYKRQRKIRWLERKRKREARFLSRTNRNAEESQEADGAVRGELHQGGAGTCEEE